MENTILSYNGIDIYKSDIDILVNEYMLENNIETIDSKSPMLFNGLLLYIYQNKLKYILNDSRKKNNNKIDYNLLDTIFFNIYIPLAYKFSFIPTILAFCCFVDISNGFLSEVRSGKYRNGSKVNPDNTTTVSKWYAVCENSLASNAIQNSSIGSIFALKACFQWRDSDPAQQITVDINRTQTTAEIEEKYSGTGIPVKPDILEQ